MPHVIVEFSDNITAQIPAQDLLSLVHKSVLGTGVFSTGGTRLRAAPRRDYIIGDGSPNNAFCHIQICIAPGRDPELLLAAKAQIFSEVEQGLAGVFERLNLALSFEFREIPKAHSKARNDMSTTPCAFKNKVGLMAG